MTKKENGRKEYGFGDFGKVLAYGFKEALICALIVIFILGGTLGCVSTFVRHNEYSANIVKLNDEYDVPVVRATFREKIYNALQEIYAGEESFTNEKSETLSNELDEHFKIDTASSEKGKTIYTFTFSSFQSSVKELKEEDYCRLLETIMAQYRNAYAEKITSVYSIEADIAESVKISFGENNYYLQTLILQLHLDALIREIENIAGIKKPIEGEESLTDVVARSRFASYSRPGDKRRVDDSLVRLNALYNDITIAQGFIVNNGVEKTGTKSMREYIAGQLIKDPDNAVWITMTEKFNSDSPYQQANEKEKQKLVETTEKLLDDVVQSLQATLDDYNRTARCFADEEVKEYADISSLLNKTYAVGVLSMLSVVGFTLAGALVAIFIVYAVKFNKMQRANEIGYFEPEEESEE